MSTQIKSNARRSLRSPFIFSPLTLRRRVLLCSMSCVMLCSWGVSAAPTTPPSAAELRPTAGARVLSAVALHDAARAALSGEHVFTLEHPLIPDSWPPNGRVRVYFYRYDVLPTGVARTRVHASFARVTLSVNSGEIREVKRLSGSGDRVIGQRSADRNARDICSGKS